MTGSVRGTALIVLFAGVSGWACAGLRAQEGPPDPPARPIAASAERVARELWPTEVQSPTDDGGRPRFRASITIHLQTLPAPWHDDSPTPVQERGTLYHREFLSTVTPEAFRSSAIRPVAGVSADPGTMFDPVKRAWRGWQTRRVHARVQRELDELRARSEGSQP